MLTLLIIFIVLLILIFSGVFAVGALFGIIMFATCLIYACAHGV